jgi:hypothetical protein
MGGGNARVPTKQGAWSLVRILVQPIESRWIDCTVLRRSAEAGSLSIQINQIEGRRRRRTGTRSKLHGGLLRKRLAVKTGRPEIWYLDILFPPKLV